MQQNQSKDKQSHPKEVAYLYDGTTHYVINGSSVPQYKILANGNVSFTTNAIDRKKLPGYSEAGYISVEEAKENTIKMATQVLQALIKNYMDGSAGNERNTLMALYRGIGVDVSHPIIHELKADFSSSKDAYHQKANASLDALIKDIRNTRMNEVCIHNDTDLIEVSTQASDTYQK